ncbi:MAG: protein-methionine-sulfoxide reductase catalytic subunit MsrP [Denitrovibrio sp.]|nr:MAG: protein-methionine-sulfoxide reductase catalytic subunit MsrP [Denitrovibrio sp.]
MIIKDKSDISENEVTEKSLYLSRRDFIKKTTLTAAALSAGFVFVPNAHGGFDIVKKTDTTGGEKITKEIAAKSYNNFYEFTTSKGDVKDLAADFPTDPWEIEVTGLVKKPLKFSVDEVKRFAGTQERIYRLRCVEGWSMVIPWNGFSLSELVKKCEPLSSAKYIQFVTKLDKEHMPGARSNVLEWPYMEGLRMDEAMNPLAMLVFGMYGGELPNQNGAPVRVIVPWKYGFKSIKSIVRIVFTDKQPSTSWNIAAPDEYGFYANVNPQVDHPRWSQARERRIGSFGKIDTKPFNGYADQVAHLYKGMDLSRFF